jgi:Ras-related protein Rab-7A
MVDNQQVTLQLWDTAGQEKFQSLGYAFYRGADSCALVFDLTSQKSFDALSNWKEGFIKNAGPNDPATYPFVLVGNKVDRTEHRQVSKEAIQTWCRQNGDMPYYEASALQNISVEDAFVDMVKLALKRASNEQVFSLPDTIGGAGGAIKLNNFEDRHSSGGKKVAKKSCC